MHGIILLDLGVLGTQISNQTQIYALDEGVRIRLKTVLMISNFLSGAIGSSIGSYMCSVEQWKAVSISGCCLVGLSTNVDHFTNIMGKIKNSMHEG